MMDALIYKYENDKILDVDSIHFYMKENHDKNYYTNLISSKQRLSPELKIEYDKLVRDMKIFLEIQIL